MMTSFAVATYNVLASAHIKPGGYPGIAGDLLDPVKRVARVARRVSQLNTDVICLQEVDADILAATAVALAPVGYDQLYASKGLGEPDGCAMFFKRGVFSIRQSRRVFLMPSATGPTVAGHVALIANFEHAGRHVGVATTHLKRDAANTPLPQRRGPKQIARLLAELNDGEWGCNAWVLCGDLNATDDDAVVSTVLAAGFVYSFEDAPSTLTCMTREGMRRIDYLFHSAALIARPLHLSAVSDSQWLPNESEPSDHVPIGAQLEWRMPT